MYVPELGQVQTNAAGLNVSTAANLQPALDPDNPVELNVWFGSCPKDVFTSLFINKYQIKVLYTLEYYITPIWEIYSFLTSIISNGLLSHNISI